jgi:squalene synthase HpnC
VVTAAAYARCLHLAQQHYENFPVASRLLPGAARPHIAAIYAFARIADDFADEGQRSDAARLALLDDWRRRLQQAAGGATPAEESDAGAIFLALGDTMRRCRLEVQLFEDLLSAFRQDVLIKRYETWADVLEYCRRSANPVGRLVLRIAGYRDEALDRQADAVCSALQLTNFWQDLEIDWRRGRLYVPMAVVRDDRGPGDSATVCRGTAGRRRRVRTPPLGVAGHVARRHAHSRPAGSGRIRRVPRAPDARMGGCGPHRLANSYVAAIHGGVLSA